MLAQAAIRRELFEHGMEVPGEIPGGWNTMSDGLRDTMWNTSSGGSGMATGGGFGMGNNDDDLTTALIVLGRYLMGNPLRDSSNLNNMLRDSSTTLRDGNTTMHTTMRHSSTTMRTRSSSEGKFRQTKGSSIGDKGGGGGGHGGHHGAGAQPKNTRKGPFRVQPQRTASKGQMPAFLEGEGYWIY